MEYMRAKWILDPITLSDFGPHLKVWRIVCLNEMWGFYGVHLSKLIHLSEFAWSSSLGLLPRLVVQVYLSVLLKMNQQCLCFSVNRFITDYPFPIHFPPVPDEDWRSSSSCSLFLNLKNHYSFDQPVTSTPAGEVSPTPPYTMVCAESYLSLLRMGTAHNGAANGKPANVGHKQRTGSTSGDLTKFTSAAMDQRYAGVVLSHTHKCTQEKKWLRKLEVQRERGNEEVLLWGRAMESWVV